MQSQVIYVAAHADFPDTEPLGGGKAVADYLCREWQREKPFPLTVLSPRSLGLSLPKSLTEMSELQYARFCRQFERVATSALLQHDPRSCVILANDISEGPDFGALGEHGYRMATIFHVDVVEYFTRFYLRNLVKLETVARWNRFHFLPDVLKLVFHKQAACVRHSVRLILPSEPMRVTVRRCYPWCPEEKIVVLPWGNIAPPSLPAPLDTDPSEFIIMTLSRLSPEKGIERLIAATHHLDTSHRKFHLFICGAAAYMSGRVYERKLRQLAAKSPIPITFTGHITGGRKTALLQRADLFLSPSHHESYGLTIAEAQAAGCPVISHDHYGARGEVVDCANAKQFAVAIMKFAGEKRRDKRPPNPTPSNAAKNLAAVMAQIA